MAQRRNRHFRRNVLVFLGSLTAHVIAFMLVATSFHFYPEYQETQQAVVVEIVPEPPQPVPPIVLPPVTEVKPTETPPSPPPTPQPQPPTPQPPVQSAPERPTPQPAVKPTAPTAAAAKPTPTPAPKPAPAPTPLAPAPPAPQPGPPKTVSRSTLLKTQEATASQAPKIVLHRDRDHASPLAPSVSIPGAIFAPPAPQAAGQPAGGAPGGPGGGPGGVAGLPGGALPGFGKGLRGGVLGCANADALHFTPAERARCAEQFGEGAKESPQMDAIDASKRQELDHQAAGAAAAQKYRDSMPTGTVDRPIAGQPRAGHSPAGDN
ncbi:MAG TPA: hypothetical protein VGI95_10235 [Caulobacteraceae bacterium]|jgi:outer membrane biosynthesis protein TonB